jgi:hypothetical protein
VDDVAGPLEVGVLPPAVRVEGALDDELLHAASSATPHPAAQTRSRPFDHMVEHPSPLGLVAAQSSRHMQVIEPVA